MSEVYDSTSKTFSVLKPLTMFFLDLHNYPSAAFYIRGKIHVLFYNPSSPVFYDLEKEEWFESSMEPIEDLSCFSAVPRLLSLVDEHWVFGGKWNY